MPAVKKDEIIKYISAFVEEFTGEHGIKMSTKHCGGECVLTIE
jgi:hypothetical protein